MPGSVLFINPGNTKATYQDLSKEFTAIDVPIWACLLADYLRRKDIATSLYDVNVEGWDIKSPEKLLKMYRPFLIVIMVYGHHPSASTQTMPAASRIINEIKKAYKDMPIAIGGTHPSALPEKTLLEVKADFVVIGEGPSTLKGLADFYGGKKLLHDIPGLAYRDGERIQVNQSALIIKNLDEELSGYAWDLLPSIQNYRAHNWHCFQDFENSLTSDFSDIRTPYISLYGSLGCPYSCTYCCINAIFGKPGIRYWSIDTILGWIEQLVTKYHVKNIRFADELFILSPKRVEEFCKKIIERKYNLNIWVYARVDTVKKEQLPLLKKAGINWLCLGIESGNAGIRDGVNKTIRPDIKHIVKAIQDNDIYVMGNYMFGLPNDSLQTMEDTLRLALDLSCEFSNLYSVMAYPGSQLYKESQSVHGILPDTWEGYSQHSYETKPLPTKFLSAAEVLKFRDDAFMKIFTHPDYLNFVKKRFGERVVSHLEKVTQVKLKRKIIND
jgi:anaerobic magnesium-protoporphyrin IX monomethyl ester cyclase